MTPPSLSQNISSTLMALALGMGMVVFTGVLYGQYSQRWGPPARLVEAGKHLESMPSQIGPWQLAEEMEMSELTLTVLECAGYVNRRYINQETGQLVNVAVIVGPSGPTAVHTPEICYSSRAYEIETKRSTITLENEDGKSHTFWKTDFRSRDVMANQLRVYYAWNRGDNWSAAAAPRYEYAAAPLLYKIQLACSMEAGIATDDSDPGRQFLAEFVNSNWSLTPLMPQPTQKATNL